jgi:GMP synthase-like glutamine amidotransferase
VLPSTSREFGKAMIKPLAAADSILFQGLFDGVTKDTGIQMWMSHGDKVILFNPIICGH